MKARRIALFVFFLNAALFGCQRRDSGTSLHVDDAVGNLTFHGHQIAFYLEHPLISQVCKDLFVGARAPSDDADVLSVVDSLFTSNVNTQPFYFLTLTRTMGAADGAYSEALGVAGRKFVESSAHAFVSFFKSEKMLTSGDFDEWAKLVAGEIQISAEGREAMEVEKLRTAMVAGCLKCDAEQMKLIDAFVSRVWRYFE